MFLGRVSENFRTIHSLNTTTRGRRIYIPHFHGKASKQARDLCTHNVIDSKKFLKHRLPTQAYIIVSNLIRSRGKAYQPLKIINKAFENLYLIRFGYLQLENV